MEKFVHTHMFLSVAERDALKKLACKRKVSAASVLREILDKGLDLQNVISIHSPRS
jgi:hypothetical protein